LNKAACIGFGFSLGVKRNDNRARLNMSHVRIVTVDDRPTAKFGRYFGAVQENDSRPLICGI
jgi:hypothetical protein